MKDETKTWIVPDEKDNAGITMSEYLSLLTEIKDTVIFLKEELEEIKKLSAMTDRERSNLSGANWEIPMSGMWRIQNEDTLRALADYPKGEE